MSQTTTLQSVKLTKIYNETFSDFNDSTFAVPKSYVDYINTQGLTSALSSINELRTELLGVTSQSLLTESQKTYNTIKKISDELLLDDQQVTDFAASLQLEVSNRENGISAQNLILQTEINRSLTAEHVLKTQFDTEAAARVSGMSSEIYNRFQGDQIVLQSINSERDLRTAQMSTETLNRNNADNAIRSSLNTYVQNNDSFLAGLTFNAPNNSYDFNTSIKLDSTVAIPAYFQLSSAWRTFSVGQGIVFQHLNNLNSIWEDVLKIGN